MHRRSLLLRTGAFALAACVRPPIVVAQATAQARTLRVGSGPGALATIADAAKLAQDGDTVEIDAGEYRGDVALWLQKRLTIRARRGPVRVVADGRAAEDKAIWVIRNGEFDIEGIEFTGCRVADRNGAGIRFEGGHLRLKWCRFVGNENGLLAGNDASASFEAAHCEFSDNGHGDGYSHNLYVGAIDCMEVAGCYFARARAGHLLKCRARESRILYNRLTDESGSASYELDLPNGGAALLLGNLIVQEAGTENTVIVSYGTEGYRWPRNALTVVHNTLVNRRQDDARFLRVAPGAVDATLRNNLLVGTGRLDGVAQGEPNDNPRVTEAAFSAPRQYDFTLPAGSDLRGRASPIESSPSWPMRPSAQYLHPMRLVQLSGRTRLSHGAFQE